MNDTTHIRQSFRERVANWKNTGILFEKLEVYSQETILENARKDKSARKGFGIRYYYMMRLLDAFLATEKLELSNCAPHKAASTLLEQWFYFLTASPQMIVSARHRLKYAKVEPMPEIVQLLEQVIAILEKLIQMGQPADSLHAKGLVLNQKINKP